jgi:hypothetical protein
VGVTPAVASAVPQLTITPAVQDAGAVTAGQSGGPMAFVITNVGDARGTSMAVGVFGGDYSDFTVDDTDCVITHNGMLEPGESCVASVTFKPSASGSRTTTLTAVVAEANGNPRSSLSGTGVTGGAAALTMTPTLTDWGGQPFGTTPSTPQLFTVTNDGGATATIRRIDVLGTDSTDFTADTSNCMNVHGGRLAAGDSCTVSVTFSPVAAAGTRTARLAVTSDNGNPTSSLSGLSTDSGGGIGSVAVAPMGRDFGSLQINRTSAPQVFTVTNNGGVQSTIRSVVLAGGDPSQFSVDATDCTDAHADVLQPSESCNVSVNFTPTAVGLQQSWLRINTDSGDPTVALSGRTLSGAVTIYPGQWDFRSVDLGDSSAAREFVVRNGGSGVATITSIAMVGGDPGDFPFDDSDCMVTSGGRLDAGSECTVKVRFKPTGTGTRTAELDVTSDGGSPTSELRGIGGQVPNVRLSPLAYGFGEVVLGSSSSERTFTLTNVGGSTATVSTVDVIGADRGDFPIVRDGCSGRSLATSASCDITVRFTPTALGARAAQLSVTSDGGDPTSDLSGTGTPVPEPHVGLSPATADFGSVPLGATGGAHTFTVTNDGAATATISSIEVSGGNAASDFTRNAADCLVVNGGRLDPGRSCQVDVTFRPSAVGSRTSTLQVASDGGNPSSALSGTGVRQVEPPPPPPPPPGGGPGPQPQPQPQPRAPPTTEPPGGSTYPPNSSTAVYDGHRYLYLLVTCPRSYRPRCGGSVYGYTTRVVHKKGKHRKRTVVRITSRGRVSVAAGRREVIKLAVSPRYRRAVAAMARTPQKRLLSLRRTLRAKHHAHNRPHTTSARYHVLPAAQNTAKPPARARPKPKKHKKPHTRPGHRRRATGAGP